MAERILDWHANVDGDVSHTLGPQEALRIRMIGTDKTASITPSINGNQVGAIRQEIAALNASATTEHGMLDLGDLYYYVPPEGTFSLNGASGDLVGLSGEWIDTPSSRFEAGADESRFQEQGQHHWTFTQGSAAISAPISDGQEDTIHTLTPNTDERYEFVGLQEMEPTTTGSFTEARDKMSVFYVLDGQQWPSQFGEDNLVGVDYFEMQRPPQDSDVQTPFVWGMDVDNVTPLTLRGDETLEVKIRNTSGGQLAGGGSNPTFTYTAAVRFQEGLT